MCIVVTIVFFSLCANHYSLQDRTESVVAPGNLNPESNNTAFNDDKLFEADDTAENSAYQQPLINEIRTLNDYFEFRFQTGLSSEQYNKLRSDSQVPGVFVKLLADSDNYNTPLDRLTVYSLDELSKNAVPRTSLFTENRSTFALEQSSRDVKISGLNHLFPVQRITAIDDDHVCFIYKTEYNGTTVYNYKVYERLLGANDDGFQFETWYDLGENYYIATLFSGNELKQLKPGNVIDKKMLSDLMMIRDNGSVWFNDNTVKLEYQDESVKDKVVSRVCKAAILLEDGVAVITSRTDAEYTTRVLLEEIEFYPYGVKCEKYPLISVLSDGFVPPLPD